METNQGYVTGHGQADGAWRNGLVGQPVFVGPGPELLLLEVAGGDPPDGEPDEFGGKPAIGSVRPMLGRHPVRIR